MAGSPRRARRRSSSTKLEILVMTLPRALAVALLVLLARPVAAQEPPTLTPSKEHEGLAHEVGVWDGESSMWTSPDSEPVKSKGVETNKLMGKFWLLSEFVGDMMGEKFEGRGVTGYDPLKKQYVGTWVDTMVPFVFTLSGTYDEATHTLTMTMEGIDAMTGKPSKWKSVTVYTSDDTKTFELHVPGEDGKLWKMMEIKYTRRK
jgi:hypothetical protein